jgi:hypothetical protein
MMSVFFDGTGGSILVNTASPITAVPFTVAFWARPATTGATRVLWAMNPAVAGDFFQIVQTVVNRWAISIKQGGTTSTLPAIGAILPNAWTFVVARFASDSSVYLNVVTNGTFASGSSTGGLVPASIAHMEIGGEDVGGSTHFNGRIAEFWFTNTDIQPDGLVLPDALVQQLAFGGPFSTAATTNDVVEYHSLRSGMLNSMSLGDDYFGKFGEQFWTAAGTQLGLHPPLPYSYARPPVIKNNANLRIPALFIPPVPPQFLIPSMMGATMHRRVSVNAY